MKGLILCAGKGTRLQPFSFSQPKTLLPVANKPVLFYGIEQLVAAGITDIGIVVSEGQHRIIADAAGSGEQFGATLTYLFQRQPLGIADAVGTCESFIAGQPFILLLGDNLIQEPLRALKDDIVRRKANACICLAEVDNPQDYGVAEIRDGSIVGLEEKPAQPKSKLAVVGAYAFDSSIFEAIRSIVPSRRGEYEITDAIQWLIDQNLTVTYSVTASHYSDVGNVTRWLEANRWMLDETTGGHNVIADDAQLTRCVVHPPVMIGSGSVLIDCVIGPYVSIQSQVTMEQCTMENSIVLKGATIKRVAHSIRDSIFGEYSEVAGSTGEARYQQYIIGDKSSLKYG